MVSTPDERGFANWPATRPTLTIGDAAAKVHHHRHLQEQAEEIADIVGRMLAETLGAVAALEQEPLARRRLAKRALQLARLAREHQRRIARQRPLRLRQRGEILVDRRLFHGLCPPALGRPTLFRHFRYASASLLKEPPLDRNRPKIQGKDGCAPAVFSPTDAHKRRVCGEIRSRPGLVLADGDIRRRGVLHAHDMVARIDMQDFAGHATRHRRQEVDGALADFLGGHGAAERRVIFVPAQDIAEVADPRGGEGL